MYKSLKTRALSYMLVTLALSACSREMDADEELAKNLATAEGMIDAFYSFDPTKLQPYLSEAGKAEAGILGYQAWAEGGNYIVIERAPCTPEKENVIAWRNNRARRPGCCAGNRLQCYRYVSCDI